MTSPRPLAVDIDILRDLADALRLPVGAYRIPSDQCKPLADAIDAVCDAVPILGGALLRKWDETQAATPGDPANVIAPAVPRGFISLAEYIASLTPEQRALMDQARERIKATLADPLAYVCPSCGRGYGNEETNG